MMKRSKLSPTHADQVTKLIRANILYKCLISLNITKLLSQFD